MCNMTFLNHTDYVLNIKDFVWNIKVEGVVGEIYFKEPNFIFGRNYDSTFVVISPSTGSEIKKGDQFRAYLDPLKPDRTYFIDFNHRLGHNLNVKSINEEDAKEGANEVENKK